MFARLISILVLAIMLAPPIQGYSGAKVISRLPTKERVVALTFDDGPNPFYTPLILRILKEHRIPATFFLLGDNVTKYPLLTKQLVQLGHDLGNHSFSHMNYTEHPSDDVKLDVLQTQAAVKKTVGVYPKFFRPPYGRLRQSDVSMLERFFVNIVHWTVDSRDWEQQYSTREMIDRVTAQTQPGDILLFHDSNERTVQALPQIIRNLKKKGYRFVLMTPYL